MAIENHWLTDEPAVEDDNRAALLVLVADLQARAAHHSGPMPLEEIYRRYAAYTGEEFPDWDPNVQVGRIRGSDGVMLAREVLLLHQALERCSVDLAALVETSRNGGENTVAAAHLVRLLAQVRRIVELPKGGE